MPETEGERVLVVQVQIPYFGKKGLAKPIAMRLAKFVKLKFGPEAKVITNAGREVPPADR